MDIVWWIVIGLLFLLAYVGLVVPLVPDMPFLIAGLAIYEFVLPGNNLGWFFWSSVIVLTIVLFFLDYLASGIAAKKYGGSKWAVPASVVGIILFPFILGPVGMIVGPFAMVLLVELLQNKRLQDAVKVAFGTLVGFFGGIFVKFFTMTVLLIWFGILVFK